jgi:hypothetical protein
MQSARSRADVEARGRARSEVGCLSRVRLVRRHEVWDGVITNVRDEFIPFDI